MRQGRTMPSDTKRRQTPPLQMGHHRHVPRRCYPGNRTRPLPGTRCRRYALLGRGRGAVPIIKTSLAGLEIFTDRPARWPDRQPFRPSNGLGFSGRARRSSDRSGRLGGRKWNTAIIHAKVSRRSISGPYYLDETAATGIRQPPGTDNEMDSLGNNSVRRAFFGELGF